MKQFTGIVMIFSFAMLFVSCKKQGRTNCELTHAKVLRYDCDRVILQVLDNRIDGDAEWTDTRNGNTYSNVVSYYNTCAFSFATNNVITDIYIEGAVVTTDPLAAAGCMQCQAISPAPPQTKIDMARFSLVPCSEAQ